MNWVVVPEKIVVPVPAKKFPEVRQKPPFSSRTPVFWDSVPPSIATVESETRCPDPRLNEPPSRSTKFPAANVPEPRSSAPPEMLVDPRTASDVAPTCTAPPDWERSPRTVSEPESICSVVFEFTVRFLTANAPDTWIEVGVDGASVTSMVESGTPSGLQLAASPQFDVPAPPSQDAASVAAVPTTK